MIIEMHCHTREHSDCSHVAAADLARRCFEEGLQGLIFTDHHHLWSEEEIRLLRLRLPLPGHFLIFPGQEVATADFGDVLVYGAPETIPRGTSLAAIRQGYPQAALVWAHPYRKGAVPGQERLLDSRLDGVEIFNSNHTVTENNRGLRDWHALKFTALAGTDTHAESYTATYPTIFDHPVRTIGELAEEIKRGRCRPFFREIPRSGTTDTEVTEINLGTDRDGRSPETIVVKTHESQEAWETAARTARIMEAIASCGFDRGPYRIPRPLGTDRDSLISIEQGIRGRTLFDQLVEADRHQARRCLKRTGQWLARLHNCHLRVSPPGAWLENEPKRLNRYVSALYRIHHPHTRKGQEIMDHVLAAERAFFQDHPERLVQGHGDFHPKNIFIGQDDPGDSSTFFVAAIDFDSSYVMPPAFDVGTFLAQYQNQFFGLRQVPAKAPPELFLNAYLQEVERVDADFLSQVELFKARTSLSIVYYLVKVGLGDSENLWRVLISAEQNLARVAFHHRERLPDPL